MKKLLFVLMISLSTLVSGQNQDVVNKFIINEFVKEFNETNEDGITVEMDIMPGDTFNQKMAEELAQEEDLVLLCGHYEGIDERVLEEIVTDYVSIGDYVLTGGELPAMVMVDTISRLVPGVLHNDVSAEFESFQDNLLEYPQYSRPEEWHGKKVPAILLSGHHANIEKWRREQSIIRTKERRPDLFEKCELTKKEKKWLEEVEAQKQKYDKKAKS